MKKIMGGIFLLMSIVLFFVATPKPGLEVPNFLARVLMGTIGFYYLIK